MAEVISLPNIEPRRGRSITGSKQRCLPHLPVDIPALTQNQIRARMAFAATRTPAICAVDCVAGALASAAPAPVPEYSP